MKAVYKSGIPLKINCVPVQGVNIDEIPDFFTWAKEKQIAVRFIEMMPIGYGDQYEAFSAEQIKEMFFCTLSGGISSKGNPWKRSGSLLPGTGICRGDRYYRCGA